MESSNKFALHWLLRVRFILKTCDVTTVSMAVARGHRARGVVEASGASKVRPQSHAEEGEGTGSLNFAHPTDSYLYCITPSHCT